ncbi:MAG: hypothetical protein NVS3B20_24070 [Polyangiales bacterium]
MIETAGGLYSPLDDDGSTNGDLLRALLPRTSLLVAPNRLGVLHDVGAVRRAAALDGLRLDAVLLSSCSLWVDGSTAHNENELRRQGLVIPFSEEGLTTSSFEQLQALLRFT